MSNSACSEMDFTNNSVSSELDFTNNCILTQKSLPPSLSSNEETEVLTVVTQTELCSNYTNGIEQKYECHVCHKKFSSHSIQVNHIKQHHPEYYSKPTQKIKMYSCKICQKSFSATRTLMKHLKTLHNICHQKEIPSIAKSFKCDICGQSLVNYSSMRRHVKHKHNKEIPPKMVGCFKCSECPSSFPSRRFYFDHIITVHGIAVNMEVLQFETAADFESWKSGVEKDTASYFRVEKRSKKNDSVFSSYTCHRSGSFVSKNTGKRRLKTGGSNKIECFCPASISVQGTNAGKAFPAEVNFIPLHLGHDCEIGKLRIKQRESCQQATNDIVRELVRKLEEFSNEDQCTEIDRVITMLTALKNKKSNVPNIEPQKKLSKRRKKDSAPLSCQELFNTM